MSRAHRNTLHTMAPVLALGIGLGLATLPGCGQSIPEQVEEARLQQELGSWSESIEILRSVLEAQPEHPEANLLLGRAQLGLGQPGLAIWPLGTAARAPELANAARLALAGAYLQLEQREQAIEAADQVLAGTEDEGQRLAALRLRAAAHFVAKDWDAALEDVGRILEAVPEDADARMLRARVQLEAGRAAEAVGTLREIWEDPPLSGTQVAAQAGLGLARLYAENLEDPKRAEEHLEDLVERFPGHEGVLRYAVGYLTDAGDPERATELLRSAVERAPESLPLRGLFADHLLRQDRAEEAEALLREATELLGTAAAWLALAEFHRQQDRPGEALLAMEEARALVPAANDYLRFKHAGILADAGRLEEAQAMAREIEEPSYRDVILGRIAYEQGDPRRALELLDEGLRRWPNNSGARYLAGKAALRLGQVDRAVAEFREAVRAGPGETDAALELARLRLAQEQPAAALQILSRMLGVANAAPPPPGRRLAGLVLMGRAQRAAGQREAARRTFETLVDLGRPEVAAVELAELAAEEEGPAAAVRVLEEADLSATDPKNEDVLRALAKHLLAAGRAGEALARVEGVLDARPEVASLHDLRARLLAQVGRTEDAEAAFRRALELDPDLGPALAGLAGLADRTGDTDRAIELLDRAAEADPTNPDAVYRAAQLALAGGDAPGAERRLHQTLARDPLHAEASNDLAWILAERGEDLDRALQLAQRASGVSPSPTILDTLGWVRFQREEFPEAVQALEQAHELAPESPSIAYRLGLALASTGETERARELLRAALETSAPFPEAQQARERLEQLAAAGS